jgi:hypothetical protein
MFDALAPLVALQLGGLLDSPVGMALGAVIVIGLVILVGRIALKIAWRLVTIAAVILGALWLVTTYLL